MSAVNKKLGRLIQPGMLLYFIIMFAFASAALLFDNFILAAVEGGVSLLLLIYTQLRKVHRRKEISAFIQSTTEIGRAHV